MTVKIDYEQALGTLREQLNGDGSDVRCQNPDCGSPRLDWYLEGDVLVVDCEDCTWRTEQRFDGTRYQ